VAENEAAWMPLALIELVERVCAHRQPALILRAGTPVARIVPVTGQTEPSDDLLAFLRRWRTEYPDPGEQLEADIQASRRGIRPPHDPWA
jgi:antitoxin (DNA-binding transcriptional repressor) of toxin-antitoxin stability system